MFQTTPPGTTGAINDVVINNGLTALAAGEFAKTGNGIGTITAENGYYVAGGVAGISATKTVRASGGASDCTLIFTKGLLTGGSC
jgi:hypothetical protein